MYLVTGANNASTPLPPPFSQLTGHAPAIPPGYTHNLCDIVLDCCTTAIEPAFTTYVQTSFAEINRSVKLYTQ